MKKLTLTSVALVFLAPLARAEEAAPVPAYQPFPQGYGYMEPTEIRALQKAVHDGDHAVVREHGWRLWAGIMQPAKGLDWPVWFTWPNTKAAFVIPPTSTLNTTQAPSLSLLQRNIRNVNIPPSELPVYPIPLEVMKSYPNATRDCGAGVICDGAHVLFNGDIMIPTESLSKEGFDWIRGQRLYEKSQLDTLFAKHVHETTAPQRHGDPSVA